jgi:hypothetical protein
MLTEAEAIERARAYAEANGHDFPRAVDVRLERRRMQDGTGPKAGFQFVYVLVLGTTIPMPRVEVDAIEGKVLAWRRPPR